MSLRTFALWGAFCGLLGAVLGARWAMPKTPSLPASMPAIILSPKAQVAGRNLEHVTMKPLPKGAPIGKVLDQVQVKLEPLPQVTPCPIDLTVSMVETPQGVRAVVQADGAIVAEANHLEEPRPALRLPRWSAGVLKDTQRGLVATAGRSWGPVELRVEAYKGGQAVGVVLRW